MGYMEIPFSPAPFFENRHGRFGIRKRPNVAGFRLETNGARPDPMDDAPGNPERFPRRAVHESRKPRDGPGMIYSVTRRRIAFACIKRSATYKCFRRVFARNSRVVLNYRRIAVWDVNLVHRSWETTSRGKGSVPHTETDPGHEFRLHPFTRPLVPPPWAPRMNYTTPAPPDWEPWRLYVYFFFRFFNVSKDRLRRSTLQRYLFIFFLITRDDRTC